MGVRFPGDLQSNAQATLAGGRVFVGSAGGIVYSLSAATGCVHWFFETGAPMRAAISIGRIETREGSRDAAFFGDGAANAYALDAATGKLLWKTKVDNFPVARITGSPTLHAGRLYVPVASSEEGAGSSPAYECCRFRGSVVALDAATGKQIWKTYTIPEEAIPTRRTRSARSCGDRPARRSGAARPSTSGATRSTSRPATTTAIRPRA